MNENAALKSALDFKTIFNSLPGRYLILCPDLYIIIANDAYQKATGTGAEIMGQHLFDVIPYAFCDQGSDAYQTLTSSFEYVLAKKKPHALDIFQVEIPSTNKQGEESELQYWSITNTPVLNDLNEIDHIIHEARDITRQIVADRLKTKSFNGLRAMAEAWGGVIWESDIKTDKLTWSKAYTDLFGYTDLQGTTRNWEELVHPDDLPQLQESLKSVVAVKSKFWTAEYRYKRADGTYAEVLDNGYLFYDAEQQPVRMLGSLIDITRPKQHERELKESKERFERVAMATNDVIWDWDLKKDTLWWNEGYKTLFGHEDEITQTELSIESWTSHIHPDDLEATKTSINEVIDQGTKWEAEYRFGCADGSYKLVLDKGYVIRNEIGEPVRMVGAMVDITEQRAIAEKLQISMQQTKDILESLPLMTWTATSEGLANYYSTRWYDFTGSDFESMKNWGWRSFIHPDDWDNTYALWTESIATGVPFKAENRWREQDGEYRWFLARAVPLYDTDGNITMWVGSHTDIEEQKQMMLALEESNSKFMMLAESIPHIVWSADPDGHVDYFNNQWYDYTKMSEEETLGFGWAPSLHPDDLQPTIDDWLSSMQTGEKYERELRLRDIYTNDYRWFLARAVPHRNAEGQIIKWFGTATYIHEQKLLREQVEESEKQFRFLADSIPQMVWTSDSDGQGDYFNQRWIDYTGLSLEESLGKVWYKVVHPDDYARALSRWQNSVRTGKFFSVEYRLLQGSDNTYRWFLGQGMPMRDEQGNIVKWFGTCTDIEDHKQTEEELLDKNLELERINQDLDSFVYTASHDLKLPIVNMTGLFDELMRVASFNDADAPKMIGMFNKSLSQLQNTIQDLSDMVKVQKSQIDTLEKVSLEEILQDVKISLQNPIQESEATITADFSAASELSFTKPGLKSVLYNLISNAIKYKALDRAPQIHLTTTIKDNFIELRISDNGLGIDIARHQNKLFQMFTRFHNHVNGSGLGLYIVNRLLTNNGGHINIESNLNKGTTFYLYFKQG
jgi:PAS domain S-box-containing protein